MQPNKSMKTYIFLSIVALLSLFGSCNADETPGGGYPAWIFLYFDFEDTDNKRLPKTSVEISEAWLDDNGNLVPHGGVSEFAWRHMVGKVSIVEGDTLFGPLLAGGNMEETIRYNGQPLNVDRYYLFRFFGQDFDTLRIHSIKIVNDQNHLKQGPIDIFYNGELLSQYFPGIYDEASGIYLLDNERVISRKHHMSPWILKIHKNLDKFNY